MLCAASIASILRGDVAEQQAMAFFEQSYRQTYLRLMVIVSGMEDVKDSGKPRRELEAVGLAGVHSQPVEVTDREMALYNLYNKVFFGTSMSPERASEGLYVTTKPRLGLTLAEKDRV